MVKVVMILDQSGSMEPIRNKILVAVNKFIHDQRNIGPEGQDDRFTLVKFSDIVMRPYTIDNELMSEVKELQVEDYKPTGGTALFDAIGTTITHFQNEVDLLMIIVTDGEENASQQYKTKDSIQQLVSRQKQDKNWSFVYLSSDLDTFQQGQGIGIQAAKSLSASTGSHNVAVGHSALGSFLGTQCNVAVGKFRKGKGKCGVQLSDE
jgi:hypothetical protein